MIRRAMFLGVLLVPGLHASVFGEVIHVPGDQPSIQAAIDVAADGDRIIVAPGTYFENIDLLGKAVTLRSSAGPDATTIDAGGKGAVITCENEEGPDTVIDGFTITGGSGTRGGGMEIDRSSPTVIDCTFLGNTAIVGGGMSINDPPSSPTVIDCTFLGNTAIVGGGMAINDLSSPLVSNCSFIQNIADPENGQGRGGGVFSQDSDSTFINCTFLGNTASWDGGGVENRGPGDRTLTLVNCLLAGNSSGFGGGLSTFFDIDTVVVNCTFVGNMANDGGAISALVNSSTTVINSILWGNSAVGLGPQIVAFDSPVTVMHSDVQGGPDDFGGDGPFDYFPSNIDADPLFVDADGADNDPDTLRDNDYRLAAGSPCIDAADNTGVPADTQDLDGDGDTDEPVPVDLDGNPRFVDDPDTPDTGNPDGINPIVDMGTYEFGPPDPCEDEDGDGRVTICHIPPGNPDNAYTLTVSVNALPAHLAHGDHCGACDEDDGLLMGGSSNVIPETVSDGPGRLRRYRR